MVNKNEKKIKKHSRMRFFIIAMACLITASITTLAYTQNASTDDSDAMGFLDPFSLTMININSQATIGSASLLSMPSLVVTRPPIRIPYKPRFRSQYKPWSDSSDIYWSW